MDHEVRGAPTGARRRGVADYVRRPVFLGGLAVGLAIVLGLVLWLALRGGGGKPASRAAPSAASIQRLQAVASSVGHPVYWAGPQPSYTYELSRTKDGRLYVRYLPPGVKLGSSSSNYLTIGTYPQRNAFSTLQATAKTQGARTIQLPADGLAFQYKRRPTSVYLAYPGSDYQIEVFDPSPARALRLVTSGAVRPLVAAPTVAASRAASVRQLRSLAASLAHPIFWVGARTGDTYELTRTKDGSVYVRYLPRGVRVGDRTHRYLTIGTYPHSNAFAALKATAAKNRVPTIALDNGGLAFVDRKSPTSVYVAYPDLDLQVEVFDPVPRRALELVRAGRVGPVR